METILLIVALLGLIPVFFLIKAKLRKPYRLDLDYKNIFFASFLDPQNSKLDGRLCLVVYVLCLVNDSDEPNTPKSIEMSYRFDDEVNQTESYVVPTGMIPKAAKPAIVLSNGIDNAILMGWQNIRTKLGERDPLNPGGVFYGSAVFLFEPNVKDVRKVDNLKLIVSDYHGNKSVHPITIMEDWFGMLDKGFAVINTTFRTRDDDSIEFE
jgi:hypothetical protein